MYCGLCINLKECVVFLYFLLDFIFVVQNNMFLFIYFLNFLFVIVDLKKIISYKRRKYIFQLMNIESLEIYVSFLKDVYVVI